MTIEDEVISRRFAQQVHCIHLKELLRGYIVDQEKLLGLLNANCDCRRYQRAVLKLFIQLIEDEKLELAEGVTEQYVELICTSSEEEEGKNVVDYKFSDDVKVSLYEDPTVIAVEGSTGHRTWEAAMALAEHVYNNRDALRGVAQFVELGAGTGLVGMLAHRLFPDSRVAATDGDAKVVSDLAQNVQLNQSSPNIATQILRWGEDQPISEQSGNQVIFCADVTYDFDLIPLLVQCLHDFCLVSKYVLLSATLRSQQTFDHFLNLCSNLNFSMSHIHTFNHHNSSFFIPPHSPDILIYKLSL
ncbi:hypothetical protein TRICI_005364 [Trichomonascus ciferrii]|uniref:FAM86 N-terminal domain-containing protein n=1 Tax=Trichomonascus ciferrii TaxID=44093 RepID=A0A642UT73_9ASCO|nr:hypothetical protein TRICI_005364 [Trichomonascus ciferrii]